jgi:phage I-like protein
VQQSPSAEQASPGWIQNDEPSLQCFVSSHRPEQHSVLPAQVLPAVLQESLSGVHVLSAPQTPPQHSALLVQALLSETHVVAEQAPATQLSEQHSVAVLHAFPAAEQVLAATQPAFASQTPEQQSLPVVHDSAVA